MRHARLFAILFSIFISTVSLADLSPLLETALVVLGFTPKVVAQNGIALADLQASLRKRLKALHPTENPDQYALEKAARARAAFETIVRAYLDNQILFAIETDRPRTHREESALPPLKTPESTEPLERFDLKHELHLTQKEIRNSYKKSASEENGRLQYLSLQKEIAQFFLPEQHRVFRQLLRGLIRKDPSNLKDLRGAAQAIKFWIFLPEQAGFIEEALSLGYLKRGIIKSLELASMVTSRLQVDALDLFDSFLLRNTSDNIIDGLDLAFIILTPEDFAIARNLVLALDNTNKRHNRTVSFTLPIREAPWTASDAWNELKASLRHPAVQTLLEKIRKAPRIVIMSEETPWAGTVYRIENKEVYNPELVIDFENLGEMITALIADQVVSQGQSARRPPKTFEPMSEWNHKSQLRDYLADEMAGDQFTPERFAAVSHINGWLEPSNETHALYQLFLARFQPQDFQTLLNFAKRFNVPDYQVQDHPLVRAEAKRIVGSPHDFTWAQFIKALDEQPSLVLPALLANALDGEKNHPTPVFEHLRANPEIWQEIGHYFSNDVKFSYFHRLYDDRPEVILDPRFVTEKIDRRDLLHRYALFPLPESMGDKKSAKAWLNGFADWYGSQDADEKAKRELTDYYWNLVSGRSGPLGWSLAVALETQTEFAFTGDPRGEYAFRNSSFAKAIGLKPMTKAQLRVKEWKASTRQACAWLFSRATDPKVQETAQNLLN